MSYIFSPGALCNPGEIYIEHECGEEYIGKAAITHLETAYETIGSEMLSFNCSASLISDSVYFNGNLFDQLCMPQNRCFKLTSNIPILIQAKWHKKPRINKKWLKRYGMISDVVKVEADVEEIDYVTPDGTLDFKTKGIQLVWRNDQLIKNRKVELVK